MRSAHQGPTTIDPQLLDRVRALLAKAESTDFPAEAEAFTAKAQELIARYRIEHLLVDEPAAGRAGGIESRQLRIDDPYARPKLFLLSEVASANGAQAVWSQDRGFATVFGTPADLDAVELLFTSLLVQAAVTMHAEGSRRDGAGRSRTRSFRRSFLLAFAARVGERLREQFESAAAERTADERSRLLPVLASQHEAVEEAITRAFPRLRRISTSVSNREGWVAGRLAADRADLGTGAVGTPAVRPLR